ncbi:MAG: biopolymer transporter ExbD [Bacteroidales bacterium]|nr:biopolymer transporter ExbD [Bacteroidales bacterium]MCF8344810.1 biopolymer transporter ExbD [Bacteroidales bacterium]MCF8352573.1 biopolymer transporter ExbD [Bacteroidales bacterium]MCF8377629.1 biopolymer transporter ExbD [Bacteroidales bacterium]MCF8402027.1 biopolymer transporter ExbD [Bacteroidales bacterium]
MSRFKKHSKKGTPGISTSSLPDIIFMLLFFFMVTTTMREATLKVRVTAPQATEVQKLEKKSLVSYIYIGPPMQKKLGTDARIQLADQFAEVNEVKEFILKEREAKNEVDRKFMITSLKVDKTTRMGIVTDVKQELREIGAFKINYSSRKVRSMEFN